MYELNKTILIGTIRNQKSTVVHAVRMDGIAGSPKPECLCGSLFIDLHGNIVDVNNHFISNIMCEDLVDWENITCNSCRRILRDLLYNEEHQIYNLTNISQSAVINQPKPFGNPDTNYLKTLLGFSKKYRTRQEGGGCCKWHQLKAGQGTCINIKECTYQLNDTKTYNCNWSRCKFIFNTLFSRKNKEEYVNFISNSKKQIKVDIVDKEEDNICENCFAENKDKDLCIGCDESNGWPKFLSEDDYFGTSEEEIKESLPNGLVELPLGINIKTVYTYPSCDGKEGEAPSLENAIFWARRSLLEKIFKDAQKDTEDDSIDGVIRAMCTDPDKYLEMLTTVLQAVGPNGEK